MRSTTRTREATLQSDIYPVKGDFVIEQMLQESPFDRQVMRSRDYVSSAVNPATHHEDPALLGVLPFSCTASHIFRTLVLNSWTS